jgi:hypothetical protein
VLSDQLPMAPGFLSERTPHSRFRMDMLTARSSTHAMDRCADFEVRLALALFAMSYRLFDLILVSAFVCICKSLHQRYYEVL